MTDREPLIEDRRYNDYDSYANKVIRDPTIALVGLCLFLFVPVITLGIMSHVHNSSFEGRDVNLRGSLSVNGATILRSTLSVTGQTSLQGMSATSGLFTTLGPASSDGLTISATSINATSAFISSLQMTSVNATDGIIGTLTTTTQYSTTSQTANMTVTDRLLVGSMNIRNGEIDGASRIGSSTGRVPNIHVDTLTFYSAVVPVGDINLGTPSAKIYSVITRYLDVQTGIVFSTNGGVVIGASNARAGQFFGTNAGFSENVIISGDLGDTGSGRIGTNAFGLYTKGIDMSGSMTFTTNQTSLIGTPSLRLNALYSRSGDYSGAVVASSFITASDPIIKRNMETATDDHLVSTIMAFDLVRYQYTQQYADYSGKSAEITVTGFNATQFYEIDPTLTTYGLIIPATNTTEAVYGRQIEQNRVLAYAVGGSKVSLRRGNLLKTFLTQLASQVNETLAQEISQLW